MTIQPGDEPPKMFSFIWEYRDYGLNAPANPMIELEQVPCYLTRTNKRTHEIIKANLDRSPLYRGVIKGVGPRYCPSIEDKVVRFPEKESHQIFIEPTGRDTNEMYPSGLNTSLPEDVQLNMLRSMAGLERVEVMRPGYAIEYDFVYPSQITHSLETRSIPGLFLAGQINGTSGYEEAAAQGIIAGINAAMKIKGREPLMLGRDEAYIGTLIDDLITKEIDEPYRMLTSRSEYRLLLRQDNADLRLTEKGHKVGLISNERFSAFKKKKDLIEKCIAQIKKNVKPAVPAEAFEQAEISIKYEGYIKRQYEQVARFKRLEDKKIPVHIDYKILSGLSNESRVKLEAIKPISLGQASRIAGVSPADVGVLLVHLEARSRKMDPNP
jgi:tRNA uridine 5-carboxymethylaminomethyl modification enzyme